ncbi:ABC transporter substrate-binding protein [Desulfatirhabdium butyrativorans]|uniref:ABC transporter substrate-binding protein n=1 Tax=Desulfatirhabdium butyrativorans TaxID=340467 RepID=UPI00040414E1|nr:ABC transporter substrate-binding protein [Desulfatirhabdium butyrativorans]
MKQKWGKILLAVVLMLGMAFTGYAKDGIDATKKIIRIAGYDACTGKYGDYGMGDRRGQEIAVEEINRNGGIQAGPLKGYKLSLEFFDDRGDPKESANIAKKVAAGDFLVALGPTMSSCALAATPVYARGGVANIITYSNANTITEQGFDNLLRLTYTTGAIAKYMAEQIKDTFKKSSVAVISENQDYGQQLLKYFRTSAKELGIGIVEESVITPGQDLDFNAVLMKSKAANPGMLVLFVTYNEAGMLVKQTRQMGWDVPIYVPDAMTEPKFFELAGDVKDVYIQLSPTIDIEKPAAKALKEEWNKKYSGFPPLAAIYGYDAVKVVVAVIEKGATDRKSFIKLMKTVQVEGVGNPLYAFDARGESKAPPFVTMAAAEYAKNLKK